MDKVHSKDGTSIAYDRFGQGPALIMVNGALASRSAVTSSFSSSSDAGLSQNFTVFAFDRRGRGESGDTPPYAVEREVEDIDAIISESGGPAYVYGHSSGAILALEAARQLPGRITRLALYEPPFIIDDSRPPVPADYIQHLLELARQDHRNEILTYFMTQALRVSPEELVHMQNSPMWAAFKKMAHTVVYDSIISADVMQGRPEPLDRWASVKIPTLVMDGGDSPAFMHHGAETLTGILPNAKHRRFPGQSYGAAKEVLVPELIKFFRSD